MEKPSFMEKMIKRVEERMSYRKPVKTRILCMLLSVVMVLSFVQNWSFQVNAYSDTDITVTIKDEDGVTHSSSEYEGFSFDFSGLLRDGTPLNSGDVIRDGDRLSFTLTWNAGSFTTKSTNSGSFEVTFNNLLTKHASLWPIDLHNVKGTGCNADFYLDPTTGVMKVTVRPDGQNESFEGECNVDLTVKVNTSQLDDGKVVFSPIQKGVSFSYAPATMTASKGIMGNIYKSGDNYYQNFYVDLNVSGGTVNNVNISDTYGSLYVGSPVGMALASSTDWVEGSIPAVGTSVAYTPGANQFSASFDTLTGSQRLVYALQIDPASLPTVIKSVNSYPSDDSAALNTASAVYSNSVTSNIALPAVTAKPNLYSASIGKTGTLNKETGTIEWKITFNPGTLGTVAGVDDSVLTVTDTPDGTNLTLADLKAALTASGITYTEEGGAVKIGGSAFSGGSITYTTPVPAAALSSRTETVFKNDVKADYKGQEFPGTASVGVKDDSTVGGVVKSVTDVDPAALTITWRSEIDIPTALPDNIDSVKIDDTSVYYSNIDGVYTGVSAVLKGALDSEYFSYYIDGAAVDNATMFAYMSDIYYIHNYDWNAAFASGQDNGFRFTLGNAFITDHGGSKLTIVYKTDMAGDLSGGLPASRNAFLKYANTLNAAYMSGYTQVGPTETGSAEYKPSISAKKIGYDFNYYSSNPKIYSDYGNGGNYPLLAFWEIKIKSENDLVKDQVIKVVDTVGNGGTYYDGSAVVTAYGKNYDSGSYTDVSAAPDTYGVSVSAAGSVTTFSITVTEDLAAAAKLNDNTINLVYATQVDDSTARSVIFGDTVKITNSADVYIDEIPQAKGLTSTQSLKASSGVCAKYLTGVDRRTDEDLMGLASYRIIVNKDREDLSSDGTIIVDDWLGGNLENPKTVKITKQKFDEWGNMSDDGEPTVYTVKKNTGDGTAHSYFLLGGVISDIGAIYKTGVGKKMTFTLQDNTCYKIEYDLEFEKTSTNFTDQVEVEARYSNTAVVRTKDGNSASKSVSISTSDYHVQAGVKAGSMNGFIIFDIKKVWGNDNGKGRPESLTLHIIRKNLTNSTQIEYDQKITVNDNAVEQEDGSWLFALKLPALTEEDGVITKYSYTIEETTLNGYAVSWSNQPKNVVMPDGSKGMVVASTLTNTGKTRFTVRKTDINGLNEISGASLAIYKAEDVDAANQPLAGRTPVQSWVSDGTAYTTGLDAGDYVLIETGDVFYDAKTDKNYKVTSSAVKFTVTGSGITSVTGQNSGYVTAAELENGYMKYTAAAGGELAEFVVCDAETVVKTAKLSINKYGKTAADKLYGAELAVYKASDVDAYNKPISGRTPVVSWTTAGETRTVGLPDGDYVLIESEGNFTDTVTGTRYRATDASFAFTVYDGNITTSAVNASADGNGSMSFSSGTLDIFDAPVEKNTAVKTDMDGNRLEGAVLQLYDEIGNQIGLDHTSSKSSAWEMEALDEGTYYIREATAPAGCKKLSADVKLTVDKTGKVTAVSGSAELGADGVIYVKNDFSSLKITKTDMSGTAIPEDNPAEYRLTVKDEGKDLSGVRLTTAAEDTTLGAVTYADFKGNNVTFTGLKDGSYELEETKAPEGYLTVGKCSIVIEDGKISTIGQSAANGTFAVKSAGELLVKDAQIGGLTIAVSKKWTGDWDNTTAEITSVDVKLYKADDDTLVDTLTLTKIGGWSGSFNVPKNSGTYYVVEDAVTATGTTITAKYAVTVDGVERAATQDASENLAAVKNYSVTITNNVVKDADMTGLVRVDKKWLSSDGTVLTGSAIPYGSVSVRLYREDGTAVGGAVTLKSTNNWTHTFTGLQVGAKYYVKETSSAYYTAAYQPAGTGRSGLVTAHKETVAASDIVITNTCSDITIAVSKQWVGDWDNDTAQVASVTAKLYKVGDPTPIDTITLTKADGWSGSFTVTRNSGSYYVNEEDAGAAGYIITTEYELTASGVTHAATETQSESITSDRDASVKITNDVTEAPAGLSVIRIVKTDMSGTPIDSANKAKFTLTVNDAGKNLDGVQIGDTTLGAVTTVDFDGNDATFTGLPDGSYTLTETVAPDGYLTVSAFDFTVKAGTVYKINSTVTTGAVEITPTGMLVKDTAKGRVTITKSDMTGEKELAGAVLSLYGPSGDKIGGDYTSAEGSKWEVGPLTAGKYTVRETTAPDGYTLLTSDVEFTVDDTGKVSAVGTGGMLKDGTVFINDRPNVISFIKTDSDNNPIAGTVRFRLTLNSTEKTLAGVKLGDVTLGKSNTVEFDNSNATFTGLKNGSYTVEELEAPEEYMKIGSFGFTVENGAVKTISGSVANGSVSRNEYGNIVIVNRSKTAITVTKTDMSGTPIDTANKAKFRLTVNADGRDLDGVMLGDTVLGAEKYVDFEGNTATFTGLSDGSYTLQETVAPEGYLVVSTFNFTVADGKVKSVDSAFTSGNAVVGDDGSLIVMDEVKPAETTTTAPAVHTPQYGRVETTTSAETTASAAEITAPAGENTTSAADTTTTLPDETDLEEDTEIPEETVTETSERELPETPEDNETEISVITDSDEDTTTGQTDETSTDVPMSSEIGTVTGSTEDNPHTGSVTVCAAMLVPEMCVIAAARKRKNGRSDKDEQEK